MLANRAGRCQPGPASQQHRRFAACVLLPRCPGGSVGGNAVGRSGHRSLGLARPVGQRSACGLQDRHLGSRKGFARQYDRLDRQLPLLVIELHDWLFPGQAVSHHFPREIATRDRDFVCLGENIFSIANRLDDAPTLPATPAMKDQGPRNIQGPV